MQYNAIDQWRHWLAFVSAKGGGHF